MKRKVLSLLTAMALTVSALAGCGSSDSESAGDAKTEEAAETEEGEESAKSDASGLKAGFIFLHDENSTYDLNFLNAAKEACEKLGVEYVLKTNIPEGQECYEAACELADAGCDFIFADSFGHEDYMIEAAKEYPDVQFSHATGTKAHTENLDNFHNAFAAIYEGRYLAGVAAGLKLNELKANGQLKGEKPLMGYVGAFTYAEVISGYTSFYLGAKSVCPDVEMKVQFTGSWYDYNEEKNAATALIAANCDLISQHADSMGAPTACENAGIPNVSYNGSTIESCPNTFIVSSRINWAPYFEYMVSQVLAGEPIATDWTGDISTGSVVLTDVNEQVAAANTVESIAAAKDALVAGQLQVFDTATFTVNGGEVLTSHMADVDTDEAYTPDTEVIEGGIFKESYFRSAPYFDLEIDGITRLDVAF